MHVRNTFRPVFSDALHVIDIGVKYLWYLQVSQNFRLFMLHNVTFLLIIFRIKQENSKAEWGQWHVERHGWYCGCELNFSITKIKHIHVRTHFSYITKVKNGVL